MYQTGQIVSYGTTGICRISALTERCVSGKSVQYYQLEPLHNGGATVLVPTDSEPLLRKLRPVLSAAEVDTLLNTLPEAPNLWHDSEQERKNLYREIFGGSDATSLAHLACSLYRQKQTLAARGRRLRQIDETAWRDAERLLCDEFAYVLGTEPREILPRLRIDAQA